MPLRSHTFRFFFPYLPLRSPRLSCASVRMLAIAAVLWRKGLDGYDIPSECFKSVIQLLRPKLEDTNSRNRQAEISLLISCHVMEKHKIHHVIKCIRLANIDTGFLKGNFVNYSISFDVDVIDKSSENGTKRRTYSGKKKRICRRTEPFRRDVAQTVVKHATLCLLVDGSRSSSGGCEFSRRTRCLSFIYEDCVVVAVQTLCAA